MKGKNMITSLHNVVKEQCSVNVKRFSIIENEFGKNVQIFLFVNCSGKSVFQLQMFSQKILYDFIKDVISNQYIDIEKIIVPLNEDMVVYGGKNQAYIGFSKIINLIDFNKGVELLKKQGYIEFKNE